MHKTRLKTLKTRHDTLAAAASNFLAILLCLPRMSINLFLSRFNRLFNNDTVPLGQHQYSLNAPATAFCLLICR